MLFDFINSKNLSEEIKIKEVYNLFKTNSLEFNKNFLLILKEYPTFEKLIANFTKIDINTIPYLFNDISTVSSKITKVEKLSDSNSHIEAYISGILRIILSLYIIQQNNQLLIEIAKKTKNFIENFFSTMKVECKIKENIDACINNLISSYQPNSKRNNSRRSTKDSTPKIVFNDENKFMLLRTNTPHFEDLESFEKINNSIKDNIEDEKQKKSMKIDSSLTLQKMKFVQIEEDEKKININKNPIKKFNSDKVKKKIKSSSCDSNSINNKNKHHSIKKNKYIFHKKRNTSSRLMHGNNEGKIKILSEFLDSINILYKYGKISAEQKINIKQKIITNPIIIIDKFFKRYHNINITNDKNLLAEKIQTFLMDEIICL